MVTPGLNGATGWKLQSLHMFKIWRENKSYTLVFNVFLLFTLNIYFV